MEYDEKFKKVCDVVCKEVLEEKFLWVIEIF